MSAYGSDFFSRSDYERSWKSHAIWVDLRPVRARVESIQMRRPGRNDQARAYNTAGECAAAVLLGGNVRTKDSKGPDVVLPSGDEYEVRTSFWGGGKKYAPRLTSAKRAAGASRQRSMPTIWCVTGRNPQCYDGAWVAGYMFPHRFLETRMPGNGKFSWAWINEWIDDGRFRHIAEVMANRYFSATRLCWSIGIGGIAMSP